MARKAAAACSFWLARRWTPVVVAAGHRCTTPGARAQCTVPVSCLVPARTLPRWIFLAERQRIWRWRTWSRTWKPSCVPPPLLRCVGQAFGGSHWPRGASRPGPLNLGRQPRWRPTALAASGCRRLAHRRGLPRARPMSAGHRRVYPTLRLEKDPLSPLHRAVCRRDAGTAAELLRGGALVDVRDIDGMTPLHRAAWKGAESCCDVLIAAGAAVDAVSGWGLTPLHYASSAGELLCARRLLAAGAHATARNPLGQTPADIASAWVAAEMSAAAAAELRWAGLRRRALTAWCSPAGA